MKPVVIIGAGAAGIAALETFRQIDKTTPVTVISGERVPGYSPCALPYLVAGDLPYKQMTRLSADFYGEMKVKPLFGSKACKITPEKRSITLDNGKTIDYNKLLIATGSAPVIPPVTGTGIEGVFVVDTLANTRRIMNWLTRHKIKRAAVIGAGFTGIETAIALSKQGIKVTIIEMLDRVLARILDAEFARLAQDQLEELGIEVKLNTRLTEIRGKDKVTGIVCNDVSLDNSALRTPHSAFDIPCQMVIIAIGVKPGISFLEGSGIAVNKGIIVDKYLSTNREDIYAAGDAAETMVRLFECNELQPTIPGSNSLRSNCQSTDYRTGERGISAIWPNAIEQGRIAGANMAGANMAYSGAYSINVININNTPITSMGNPTLGEPKNEVTLRTACALRRIYLNQNSHITGFESIGETRNLGFIWSCITKRTDISSIKKSILKDNFVPYLIR